MLAPRSERRNRANSIAVVQTPKKETHSSFHVHTGRCSPQRATARISASFLRTILLGLPCQSEKKEDPQGRVLFPFFAPVPEDGLELTTSSLSC